MSAAIVEQVSSPRALKPPKWRMAAANATNFALSAFRKPDVATMAGSGDSSAPHSPSLSVQRGLTPSAAQQALSKLYNNSTFEDTSQSTSAPPSSILRNTLGDDDSSPRDSQEEESLPQGSSPRAGPPGSVNAGLPALQVQLPPPTPASPSGLALLRQIVGGRPSPRPGSRQSSTEGQESTPVIGFHEQFAVLDPFQSPTFIPPTPGSPLDVVAVWESELRRMINSGTMLEEALDRPGPSGGMARCCVRRIKNFLGTSCVFQLQLERGNLMLLAARKRKKSKVSAYVISRDADDLKRDSGSCVAKLKANFVGTEYNLWGRSDDPNVKKGFASEHACLSFKPSSIEGGPHAMHAVLPLPDSGWRPVASAEDEHAEAAAPPGSAGTSQLSQMLEQAKQRSLAPPTERKLSLLCSKPPEYDEANKVFCLDFQGRVKQYSVKNMQLVCWDHNSGTPGSQVVLQFGKVADDHYVLDFAYPLSVKTAFAIALAKLDTKLCYMLG